MFIKEKNHDEFKTVVSFSKMLSHVPFSQKEEKEFSPERPTQQGEKRRKIHEEKGIAKAWITGQTREIEKEEDYEKRKESVSFACQRIDRLALDSDESKLFERLLVRQLPVLPTLTPSSTLSRYLRAWLSFSISSRRMPDLFRH